MTRWRHLARIIHERFYYNREIAAMTRIRRAGSLRDFATYRSSTPRALAAPHARFATQLLDFATNRHK
jgi:hypothetical protein